MRHLNSHSTKVSLVCVMGLKSNNSQCFENARKVRRLFDSRGETCGFSACRIFGCAFCCFCCGAMGAPTELFSAFAWRVLYFHFEMMTGRRITCIAFGQQLSRPRRHAIGTNLVLNFFAPRQFRFDLLGQCFELSSALSVFRRVEPCNLAVCRCGLPALLKMSTFFSLTCCI